MGRGVLSELRVTYFDGDMIPWGIHRDEDRASTVYGGEDCGMEGLGGYLGWVGASAPADRIRGPAEVPI